MTIAVKYHCDQLEKLRSIQVGDWIDLRAAEELTLTCGAYYTISLGVSMRLPDGYEAHVAPRSSSFQKWGILQTNGVGIIDNSYSGTNDLWRMPVYATRDTQIHVNDRICQFRIVPRMPPVSFQEVTELDHVDRGGFGSTGVQAFTDTPPETRR